MIAPCSLPTALNDHLDNTVVPIGDPLVSIIKMAFQANVPILVEGPHGVGKSECVHQAGNELGIPVIDRDLSLLETSDLAGYPFKNEHSGLTEFAPPAFLPKPNQPQGLLLLEELNRSSESTRHAALQILTARRIHDYELPNPGWLPLTTINPREVGRYFTSQLDLALLSRFIRVKVKADSTRWLMWARGPGSVHSAVTNYIALLEDPFEDAEGLSTPRSWTYVSKVLNTLPSPAEMDEAATSAMASIIAGLVGPAHTAALLRLLLGSELPLDPATILSGPAGWSATVRRWREEGRLDILDVTVRQLLQHLRPHPRATRVMDDRDKLTNLHRFFRELPPDLTDRVQAFINETGYTAMVWEEPVRSGGQTLSRRQGRNAVARMKALVAAARARDAAAGQGVNR